MNAAVPSKEPREPPRPLVSVIIPAWNCERYIAQTLASVLAQSHRPLEVLVVDDGSSDRTPEIVAAHGAPVRLIRQSNQGVCVARNRGFEASRGEFVCFMDHDDHWFPWKLARQVEAFEAHPEAGVVFTDFAVWQPRDGLFPEPAAVADTDDGPPGIDADFSGWIYHQFLIDCWALTSSVMIRRGVFAASGGFDPSLPYSEDWDLWLRLSREVAFIKLQRVSTLYRQHVRQGSRQVRDINYRVRLLEAASQRWGLASADGRRVDRGLFRRTLARYEMQFGLHHLQHGHRDVAVRSFVHAWRLHPQRLRYGALIAATLMGWRPRLESGGT